MANIKVGIVADTSQYDAKMKASTDAAINFGQKAEAAGNMAQRAMNKLGEGAEVVKSKMESLGALLVGVGLIEFAKGALESAANAADLAAAIGVTTQSMMELQLAGLAAGKNVDDMANMVQKLNIATNNAAEGSTKLQSGFAALGLNMQEVLAMNPDERFIKVTKALAGVDDVTKRTALSLELLGKGGTKADLLDIAESAEKFAGTQGKAAESAKAAKEVLDKFAVTAQMVKNEFVALAGPILSWIEPFVGGANKAKTEAQLLAGALGIFAAAGTITAINSIIKGVGSMATAMLGSAEATGIATAATVAQSRAIDTFMTGATGRLGTAVAALNTVLAQQTAELALGAPTMARAAIMADALAVAEERVAVATSAANATRLGAAATLSAVGTAEAVVAVEADAAAGATARLGTAMTGTTAAGSTLLGTLTRLAAVAALFVYSPDLNAGEDAKIESSKRISQAMKELNQEELDSYYKLTAAQQTVVQNAIRTGQQAKAALALGMNATEDGTIREEKKKVRDVVVDNSGVNAIKAQNESMVLNNRLALEKLNIDKDSITQTNREKVIAAVSYEAEATYLKEELRIRTEVNKLRADANREATGGDTVKAGQLNAQANALENQLALVREQTSEQAKLKIAISDATDARKAELYWIDASVKGEQDIKDIRLATAQLTMNADQVLLSNVQKRIDAEVNGAIAIWRAQNAGQEIPTDKKAEFEAKAALNAKRYTDELKNQVQVSHEFGTGWTKAWQDYNLAANDAASQARNMFSAMSNSFESAIDQIVRTGKVGWRELFTDFIAQSAKADAAKLFASFTNPSSGSGGFFSSIGKFFSGGFATGGSIPSNGFGLVGENGPELINGPATITPLTGGGDTYHVTINANDAKSFVQMMAEHPEVIYGLSLKGQRSLGV